MLEHGEPRAEGKCGSRLVPLTRVLSGAQMATISIYISLLFPNVVFSLVRVGGDRKGGPCTLCQAVCSGLVFRRPGRGLIDVTSSNPHGGLGGRLQRPVHFTWVTWLREEERVPQSAFQKQ